MHSKEKPCANLVHRCGISGHARFQWAIRWAAKYAVGRAQSPDASEAAFPLEVLLSIIKTGAGGGTQLIAAVGCNRRSVEFDRLTAGMLPDELRAALISINEEIMWLAARPNVTPSRARAWYTHVMAESVKRRILFFTGYVSRRALEPTAVLRLEHHHRIQTELSKLVQRHRTEQSSGPDEFVSFVLRAESVHIVTVEENYGAMRARGDYTAADIVLQEWDSIPYARRTVLWEKMLFATRSA